MAKKSKKNENLTLEEKLEQALVPNWDEPYKLPDNWCWVNLGSIGTLGMGQTILSKELKEEGVPVYSATEEDKIFGYIAESENTIKLYSGDIVIPARGNSIGHVKYVSCNEASCTQTTMFFKPFDKKIGKYVYYYMQGNKQELFAYHGNAIPQITITNIIKKAIPLPPLEEQIRLVERIEALFAKLDEAKEKAQEVVDGFENCKAAILHKAFSGELTSKWRESNGVPIENWINQNLSQCCKIGSGGTPSRKNSEYYNGDIPWIKTGEIEWNEVSDSEEKITQDAIENSSAKLYNPGAVLVAMYGMGVTRGRAAILGVQAATNQAVCVLQPQEHLNNRFLFYFFMCNYWAVREQAVGGNQLNLSATIIGKLNINIPSIPEQLEIVRLLDDIISKEEQTKEISEQVVEKIDTMKKSILVHAFRGELGTNDPTEESAVELLKKILDIPTESKPSAKRTFIPKEISEQLTTELEKKIVKVIIKNNGSTKFDEILAVSSKKFDVLETVRTLEKKKIIFRVESGEYTLKG